MGESTLLTQVWPSKLTVPAFCTSARFETLSYRDQSLRLKDSQNQRSQNSSPFSTNELHRDRAALPTAEFKHTLFLTGTVSF